MKLHDITILPPSIIFEVANDSLDQNTGAVAQGPVIRVKQKYIEREDEGIIAHEITHVAQFWEPLFVLTPIFFVIMYFLNMDYSTYIDYITLFLAVHPILYITSTKYRLWAEVQAYKRQLNFYGDDRTEKFAGFISTKYNLNVTKEEAARLLKE